MKQQQAGPLLVTCSTLISCLFYSSALKVEMALLMKYQLTFN
jgi:hypothetical protein